MNTIRIQHGLLETHRLATGQALLAAFGQKLRPFFGPGPRAEQALADQLDPRQVLLALDLNQLLGVALFSTEGHRPLRGDLGALVADHGVLGGLRRWVGLTLFGGEGIEHGLYLSALAVVPAAQGRGVGTRLLAAVEDHARRRGWPRLGLDVVDTNPRARSLYARFGFSVVERIRLPWLFAGLGFSGYDRMVKPLTR